jgi:PAS domain S-box-containing protein
MTEKGTPKTPLVRRWWLGYTVAIGGTIIAALARWALGWEASDLTPYITFYPVAFAAAMVGGTKPGLLATVLSVLAANVLFMEPVGMLGPATVGQAVGMALFVAINFVISILAGRFRAKSQALRESARRYQALESAGSYAVYRMNPDWTELYAMDGRNFIANTSEPIRNWLEKYIEQKDQPKLLATIHDAIRNKAVFEFEHRVRRADGKLGWTYSRAVPVLGEDGEVIEWVGTAVDVTDRKEAEQAVRQSEERLRQFIDSAPAAIAMFDKEMRYVAVSHRWLESFHVLHESLIGRSHYEVFPQIPERWKQAHQRGLAGAVERAEEDIFESSDGARQWVRWEVQPWYAAPGVIGGIIIFTEDITERKNATEALRQNEEHFRTMADAIPQLAWIARPDGYIFWYNRRSFEYTGATLKQLEGWGWQSVVHPRTLPEVLERWRRSIATGEPYDNINAQLRGADGQYHPFITRIVPLKDKAGKVTLWFGTSTDVTELREQELILGRQARLIDLAPAAAFVKRDDGTITFWSRGAEQLYGWSKDEAIGCNVHRLLRTEFPEPLESILAKVRTGCAWTGELRHMTREGQWVIVESYWLSEPNAQGVMEETLESNTDITERKRLQERLEEAVEERTRELREAMAELEHMSYSMIHDMRAPLRAMEGYAEMLERECEECRRPPGSSYLRAIRESSNRLDRLVVDALDYSKVVRGKLPLVPVDLDRLLRSMVQSYPNLQGAEITVQFGELVVLGNESLLTQCFGNLLDNAVKFVAEGVKPRVRMWAEPTDIHDQAATLICVEDNGIGIPKEAQEKIFGMFQRMHAESEYPGTGIGLAIARKAVERMNGRISIKSEPNKGTCFQIVLPRPVETENKGLETAA